MYNYTEATIQKATKMFLNVKEICPHIKTIVNQESKNVCQKYVGSTLVNRNMYLNINLNNQ